MTTFIILSCISHEAFADAKGLRQIADTVAKRIRSECPGVVWKDSYATMGRFDVVDIVESDDPVEVEKAAMIIRGSGHATTETLPATPWKQFIAKL